jgi:cysteine desulfurase / selenocysteine lyase
VATPIPRELIPAARQWVYLNHAGVCPLPLPSVEAMHRTAMEMARGGEFAWPEHQAMIEHIRAAAATLMGVPPTDVAFVGNTTAGLGFVANGLAWSAGDRVVIPDLEFPSTLYAWIALQDRGVIVDRVRPSSPSGALPLEAFAEVINDGPAPKLVATSWVQFGRGWRVDLAGLARICHDAGALLCVDVVQGLGAIPAEFEAWGVDFAMADGHKWMLGPEGCALLYVRASRLDLLRPLEPGWNSVKHREEWDNLELVFDDSARRLEGGTPNVTGIAALGASIDLLLGASVGSIWAHIDQICQRACDGLTAAGATVLSDRSRAARSGIVSFSLDDQDPADLVLALRDEGFACSARSGAVRISPHGYTTEEDIDRLIESIARHHRA